MPETEYQNLWEAVAADKAERYLTYKFTPTHRVGLTNYLREVFLLRFLDPKPDDVVLDAGSASGRQLFQIAGRIKAGYGVDIAAAFVQAANAEKERRGIPNITFARAELETLPYPKDFFDKVICAEVIEHVADVEEALRELVRVLKPGGVAVITTPNLNADGTLWGRLLRLLGLRRFEPLTEFSGRALLAHGDAHVRELDRKDLRALLTRHHLRVHEMTTVSLLDGPAGDFILKVLLHIPGIQQFIIGAEKLLGSLRLPWGRHFVVKAQKV